MKLSEYIKACQSILDAEGDVDVYQTAFSGRLGAVNPVKTAVRVRHLAILSARESTVRTFDAVNDGPEKKGTKIVVA